METDLIKRIFFPKRCPVCGEIIPIEREFCGCGGKGYEKPEIVCCEHCGLKKCACNNPQVVVLPHFTASFVYSGLAKERILGFKFFGEVKHSLFFAREMSFRFADVFSGVKADFVTFVPMRKHDEKERGFNQSELLAKDIATLLYLPCKAVLEKTRDTKGQHTLSQKERLKNLDDCFDVKEKSALSGKTIILCDDIKTTGITLKQCCDALFAAGAKDVYCLCAAVTDFSNEF